VRAAVQFDLIGEIASWDFVVCLYRGVLKLDNSFLSHLQFLGMCILKSVACSGLGNAAR